MASVEKFTTDEICNMLRHNSRTIKNPSNRDIDPANSVNNYSFPMEHYGMTDYEYYKKLVRKNYIYGRGTIREKKAITGCGWVVTLPKEIYGNSEKEHIFFAAVYDFVAKRVGKENLINNAVHYDEKGLPHIHIIFVPITNLDKDVLHHKTRKTSHAVRLESGRYEYSYKFILDDNGQKIKLKNYAKIADKYEKKIDCNTVLNKFELQNFHKDLQQYLKDNGIEGSVINGTTGGVNFEVKELKEFTKTTGLHLNDIKEIQGKHTLLESLVERNAKVAELNELLLEKDAVIKSLEEKIEAKNNIIELRSHADEIIIREEKKIRELSQKNIECDLHINALVDQNNQLRKTVEEMNRKLSEKQQLLEQASIKIQNFENEKEWGSNTETWGTRASWGDHKDRMDDWSHGW
ncbi:Plasmid recombination enzyme [Lachnospiraceae bacterium]|nr:Plasmid recombination enzyme [Lachnospiraceae bacterium]